MLSLEAPSRDEIATARRSGVKCLYGLPTLVPMRNGATATLDVSLAMQGDPDPWYVTWADRSVVLLHTASDSTLYVGGMAVTGEARMTVARAVRLAAAAKDRGKDGAADLAEAGKLAMSLRDAMVRARVLDHCDAWQVVLGTLIDESSAGRLHGCSDRAMQCRLLAVTCPSTARTYVLCVPSSCETAVAARRWTMGDAFADHDPEVET